MSEKVKRHRETTLIYGDGRKVTTCADCGKELTRAPGKRIWNANGGGKYCIVRNSDE
jgi:hypothetical protein